VKYSGTKWYNITFTDTGDKYVGKLTNHTVIGLVPGSKYKFQVYGTSVCGKSSTIQLIVDTKIVGKYYNVYRGFDVNYVSFSSIVK